MPIQWKYVPYQICNNAFDAMMSCLQCWSWQSYFNMYTIWPCHHPARWYIKTRTLFVLHISLPCVNPWKIWYRKLGRANSRNFKGIFIIWKDPSIKPTSLGSLPLHKDFMVLRILNYKFKNKKILSLWAAAFNMQICISFLSKEQLNKTFINISL